MSCTACGASAAENARFCAACGQALRTVEDERRVVSVVFADLVGFTSLSERLDPERVKDLVDRCFDLLAADVTSFGGQVDKIIGDAIVALFGATTAHEDDPERAVRAALRMQATLEEEAKAMGVDLRMRVGVNTGEVLVGAMRAAGSLTAMGDVVNTASRLQTAARPGEVLVGPATHASTNQTIAYEPRGLVAAKGRDEPVETWAAVAPTLPPGYRSRRLDVPLIGRDHELGLLQHAVDNSIRHRRAALVLVVGDVGMGKSRLADEVAHAAEIDHGAVVREGRCVPYGEANVWWPVADALRGALDVSDGASLDDARASVRNQIAATMDRPTSDPEVQRTTEGLLTLLGHEVGSPDPATLRQEAGRALGVYATATAQHRPLILQISDLHWADPAVLTLIDDVFSAIQHQPVVVLVTARPALLDEWTPRHGRHNSLTLHLDPLPREAAGELLEWLVGSPLAPEVSAALLDRSGGNPFFLEEMVTLLDGDTENESGRIAALPDTLRGLVAARLDDLSASHRSVLQNASVIGQRGPIEGLRELSEVMHRGHEVDVAASLDALVADEVMELDGEMWAFRSDLVREVAYQTLTKADRAKCHLGIAQYLEERVSPLEHRPPWAVDQLAHHYGCAVTLAAEIGPNLRTEGFPDDLADRARRWIVEAAEGAGRDQALPAAIRLYTQAIDLLGVPTTAEERTEAIDLRLARGTAAGEGWDVALGRRDAEAALVLAEASGDACSAARALVARGVIEQKEGAVDDAIATLAEAAERFRALGEIDGLGEALRQRAMVEIFNWRIVDAEASAEAALQAFQEAGNRSGQAWSLQNLAWTAFVTGRPDVADAHLASAIDIFSDIVGTQGLAWSLGLLAWVRFQQHRVAEAEALAGQVLDEATARADPWATAMMLLLQASVRTWTGRTAEAVELAEQAQRTFKKLGDAYGTSQAASVLGRAKVMVGRVDEGFALLTSAGSDGPDGLDANAWGARLTRLAASLQVGEPHRASDVLTDLAAIVESGFGGEDSTVVLAMSALQAGDVERARTALETLPDSVHPNLMAARALLAAASGTGDARSLADVVGQTPEATYLDRSIAQLAGALEAAASDDAPDAALSRIDQARAMVDDTDDRLAGAIVEIAAAAVARRVGHPDAELIAARSEHLLAGLGIGAEGWTRIFSLATRTLTA